MSCLYNLIQGSDWGVIGRGVCTPIVGHLGLFFDSVSGSVGGGGALRFEWVPTAKRPCRAGEVNGKIEGWSTPFGVKKRGGVNFKLRTQ